MSSSNDALLAITAYSWLDRFGTTPVPGGMLDQHPRFVEFVRIIESERAMITRAKDEQEAAARKRAASAAAARNAAATKR